MLNPALKYKVAATQTAMCKSPLATDCHSRRSGQVPLLLPLLYAGAKERHWKIGNTLVIHLCRVGILNEIGDMLKPRVVVLLIGERPGLTQRKVCQLIWPMSPVPHIQTPTET